MDADGLYGLPLDRFVPERTALSRSLRSDGRREDAAEVGTLRKPSVAAWAVNQLVRSQRRRVAELFDAGDQLLAAQSDVLAGRGEAGTLRAATERERTAVDALVEAARGLLTSGGHELSAAVIDRVAETLHAAALDQESRAQVRDGRLVRELRHVGLGMAGLPGPAPARARARAPARRPRTEPRARPDRAARSQVGDRTASAEQAVARTRAIRAAEAARRDVDRAARSLERAQRRRDQAATELRDAEEALLAAQADAEAAARLHRRAQSEVDRV